MTDSKEIADETNPGGWNDILNRKYFKAMVSEHASGAAQVYRRHREIPAVAVSDRIAAELVAEMDQAEPGTKNAGRVDLLRQAQEIDDLAMGVATLAEHTGLPAHVQDDIAVLTETHAMGITKQVRIEADRTYPNRTETGVEQQNALAIAGTMIKASNGIANATLSNKRKQAATA